MTTPKVNVFPISKVAYRDALLRAVRDALREDLGNRDLTTMSLRLKGKRGKASLIANQDAVLAGTDAFAATYRSLDPRIRLIWHRRDGQPVHENMKVVTIVGDAAAILSGERTALNFVSHLSGIATATSRMVSLIRDGRSRLLDTRKTTPGLRLLEKRATALGGAVNHRMGLYDALMLKDNHIAAIGQLDKAIRLARRGQGRHRLICEVRDLDEIRTALDQGVTWLLLDNFPLGKLRRAVEYIRDWQKTHFRRMYVEASGGVTARNIAAIARVGADYVSSGHITHSAAAVDFSLEWTGSPAGNQRTKAR